MKDTQIHEGLPEKEIRDFLSSSINDLIFPEKTDDKLSFDNYGYSYSIAHCKQQIEFYQKELKRFESLSAVQTLVKNKGWEEFDVSEWVERTNLKGLCRNFIGTEEEYEKFMKTNKFE